MNNKKKMTEIRAFSGSEYYALHINCILLHIPEPVHAMIGASRDGNAAENINNFAILTLTTNIEFTIARQ